MKRNLLLVLSLFFGLAMISQSQVKSNYTSYKASNGNAIAADPVPSTQVSPVVQPTFCKTKSANTVSVLTLGTSVNGLGWGYGSNSFDHVWADNDLKTISFIHRMGPGSSPPSLSGYLAIDHAANYGSTLADWSINYQVHAATLPGTTYYLDAARYPQGGLYNPAGNTDPANSYLIYYAPAFCNTTASNWGGYTWGTGKWGTQSDSTKHLDWYAPPPYREIQDGFTITAQGKAFGIGNEYDPYNQTYYDNLYLSTGIWSNTAQKYNYTASLIPLPQHAGVWPIIDKIAADPSGNDVWIGCIGNNGGASPVKDSTYYPVFIHSSDGGQTWGDPIAVTLDGPNGIPAILNYISNARLATVFGSNVPPRNQIAYTCAFDGDITVDKWGNPHMAVAVGLASGAFQIYSPDGSNSPTFDSTMAVFDIYSTTLGASWCARMMGVNKRFRCNTTVGGALAYIDLRTNIARNAAGDKIFISYQDTWNTTVTDNSAPDIFCRGWDIVTNKLTNYNGQDAATNVTYLSNLNQSAYVPDIPQTVFTKPDGSSLIPFVTEGITGMNLDNPVTFYYVPDFSFAPAAFTINAEGPGWGSSCTFQAPYPAPSDFSASIFNSNCAHTTWSAPSWRTPSGYNVYRDQVKVNTILIHGLYFDDLYLPNGTYSYMVKAVYGPVESEASSPAQVVITGQGTAPVTVAASRGVPHNSPVTIPVTVNGFSNITALSLRLDYDPSVLTFTGYENVNSELADLIVNDQTVSPSLHKVMMVWSDMTPRTIPAGGKIVDLLFTYVSGTTALTWNNTSNDGSDCEYADANGNPLPDIPTATYYINGEVHYQPGYPVSGVFKYNNTANTLLDNIKVVLKQGASRIDSVTTDANGAYNFTTVQNGTYKVLAYTNKVWSSVNATDAIKVQRHFAGLELLTEPVRLLAGDVNLSNSINATDAIKIKRRFSGLDTYFDRGDWTFAKPATGGDTIIVSGSAVTQDFYGLCVGDVNGSNTPSSGKTSLSRVSLIPDGELEINPGDEFDIPVRIQQPAGIGAVSLVLTYPSDVLSIKNVTIKQGNLLYKVKGNELRIAWSELEAMMLGSGDVLISMHCKAAQELSPKQILAFAPTSESELADGFGEPLPSALLSVPSLKVANVISYQVASDLLIYPNPARDKLTIDYDLQEDASITIDLYNPVGQLIRTIYSGQDQSGSRKIDIKLNELPAGIYMLKFIFNGKSKQTENRKLIIERY